jgi:hypothetical protein
MVPCCVLWWLRVLCVLVCVVCGVQLSAQKASPIPHEEFSHHQSACMAHRPVRVLEADSRNLMPIQRSLSKATHLRAPT